MEQGINDIKTSVTSIIHEYLGNTGLEILDFAGNVLVGLLILLIGFRLIKYIVLAIDKMMERSKMDPTLRTFLLSLMRNGLKVMVVFWAISRIGVTASTIIALLGSAGVAVGLSLQGSLGNIAGGVILLMMKPFEVGDYILEDSSGKEGVVKSIGIMYTRILSPENKTVLVPNGNLTNSSISNYTAEGNRRIKIQVGIEYDEDIRKVRKILEDIMEKEVTRSPGTPVQIFLDEFQDSCICMGVHFWADPNDYWTSKWKVQEEIKLAFDENGITIPFNKLDVNVVNQGTIL